MLGMDSLPWAGPLVVRWWKVASLALLLGVISLHAFLASHLLLRHDYFRRYQPAQQPPEHVRISANHQQHKASVTLALRSGQVMNRETFVSLFSWPSPSGRLEFNGQAKEDGGHDVSHAPARANRTSAVSAGAQGLNTTPGKGVHRVQSRVYPVLISLRGLKHKVAPDLRTSTRTKADKAGGKKRVLRKGNGAATRSKNKDITVTRSNMDKPVIKTGIDPASIAPQAVDAAVRNQKDSGRLGKASIDTKMGGNDGDSLARDEIATTVKGLKDSENGTGAGEEFELLGIDNIDLTYDNQLRGEQERELLAPKAASDEQQEADPQGEPDDLAPDPDVDPRLDELLLNDRGIHESSLKRCPDNPTGLKGRIAVSRQALDHQLLVSLYSRVMEPGGHYKPAHCRALEKTAIIVPFRQRWHHLHVLLPYLIPMLVRQNLDFTIFVVAQDNQSTFNKGLVLNAGYLEALTVNSYDCFIFHDVDVVPVDDRNLYRCKTDRAIHFLAQLNTSSTRMPYPSLFGGVVGYPRDLYRAINGASNLYFGWGAEDDDMRDRTTHKGIKIVRKAREVGVYTRVEHNRTAAGWLPNHNRFKLFKTRLNRQHLDGLNSALYKLVSFRKHPLYTWISIIVNETEIKQSVPAHLLRVWWGDRHYQADNAIVGETPD